MLELTQFREQKLFPLEWKGRCRSLPRLVAAGRVPNVEGLGLEAAGVDYTPGVGVKVNDDLTTSSLGPFKGVNIYRERERERYRCRCRYSYIGAYTHICICVAICGSRDVIKSFKGPLM